MRAFYTYLSLLLMSVLPLISDAQEATAILKDKQIKIGEQTTIELKLRYTVDDRLVKFPTLNDTISSKIEILEISELDTAYDESDITIKELSQTITITSWDSGFHAIPPFTFKVGDQSIETQAQLLEVQSISIEQEADIKDIKNIMDVPFSLWDWILVKKYWIGGTVLGLILILVAILIIRKLMNKQPKEVVQVPKEKADVLALKQLEELKAAKLWQDGKINAYYTQLSHILREYLENRFRLSALEKTTDEIDMLLKYHKEIEGKHREQFTELMQLCDMAKFAKQEPLASENEAALKYAYRFVEDTKVIEDEDEDEDEGEDGDKSEIRRVKPVEGGNQKSESEIIDNTGRTRSSDFSADRQDSALDKGNQENEHDMLKGEDKKEQKP